MSVYIEHIYVENEIWGYKVVNEDGSIQWEGEERWLPMKNFEGVVEVSNMGRFKRKERLGGKFGKVLLKEQIITLSPYSNDYLQLSFIIEGKRHTFISHRVTAEHFIPNPENKKQVNHKDGIRWNNWVQNLEWNTCSENIRHSLDILNRPTRNSQGENNVKAILSEEDVLKIRRLYREGKTQVELCLLYNMNKPAIWKIVHNYTWKHI